MPRTRLGGLQIDFPKGLVMRMVTGGLLVIAAEQAFSHAFLIGFPHHNYARAILLPFACVAIVVGIGFLIVGIFLDRKSS